MKVGDRVKIVKNNQPDCTDYFVGRTGVLEEITECGHMDYEIRIDVLESDDKNRLFAKETVPFDLEELEVISE